MCVVVLISFFICMVDLNFNMAKKREIQNIESQGLTRAEQVDAIWEVVHKNAVKSENIKTKERRNKRSKQFTLPVSKQS